MFKNLIIFSAGALVGGALVINEILQKRLVVTEDQSGVLTLQHPYATLRS